MNDEIIGVSACLIGTDCKYNGGNNYSEKLEKWLCGRRAVAVCPEVLGGLSTPRAPSEIVNGVVMNINDECVDTEFRSGADRAMTILKQNDIHTVVLQSRSPSCGAKEIYDGSFSGKKIKGQGIFAEMLKKNGFNVIDVEDI